MLYNAHCKNILARNTLKGNFVRHTKRGSKNPILLRGTWPFSLWRNVAYSAFLQIESTLKIFPYQFQFDARRWEIPLIDFSPYAKLAFIPKFPFLQITYQLVSSWTSPKSRFSRIFEVKHIF